LVHFALFFCSLNRLLLFKNPWNIPDAYLVSNCNVYQALMSVDRVATGTPTATASARVDRRLLRALLCKATAPEHPGNAAVAVLDPDGASPLAGASETDDHALVRDMIQ
jgi:hypothetical protein